MKVIATLRKSNSLVYVRLMDTPNKVDVRFSTGLYIDPIHFDAEVPGYSAKSNAPKNVKAEFNARLKALVDFVKGEYIAGMPADFLRQRFSDFLHSPDAKEESSKVGKGNACDDAPHEDGKMDGKETSPMDELPTEKCADFPDTEFFHIADRYIREKKGGYHNVNAGASIAIFRRLVRYEAWQREKEGRKDFTLRVDSFDAEEVERYMKYTEDEYSFFDREPEFFSRFHLYRSTLRPSSRNSSCSGGTRLKAFLNWCVKQGLSTNTSFRQTCTANHVYGIPYYLTIEERDKVLERDLSFCPRIERARDMFVFQCLVGCRVGDLFSFTTNNISDGWLVYQPSKNLKRGNPEVLRVPLCDKALAILKKYEKEQPRLFPRVDERFYNVAIQLALEICGINRIVPVLNPLTRKEEMLPIYEVASSHTARKTFIGNIYRHVKDQGLVASLTGHSANSKAFARYRTIDDDMKRELIDKIK